MEPGKLNLWADDSYHASIFGSYLEALTVFGAVTGLDPRSLGGNECSAFELGISVVQATALQKVAFEELDAQHLVRQPAARAVSGSAAPARCTAH